MVDLGLKPSLARYEFREEHEFEPAVVLAQDSDESLLVLVQQQSDVASNYLRNGDARKAISTLRRTHKLVEDRVAETGSPAPVQRLAFAVIRLQLCAVLSKLGRHTQALAEARAAKDETDEVWRSALGEADVEPGEPLQRLLTKPPRWLQDVVESSVQARQCVALELEFEQPAPEEPGPALEEGQTMHREAVMLAQQLLPEEHPVREAAERAMLQAELRKQEAADRAEKAKAERPTSSDSPTAAAAELLLKAARRRYDVHPAKLDATLGSGIAQRLLAALDGNMGQLKGRKEGRGDEPVYLPPGDVYSRSLRKSALAPEERGGRNLSTCLTPSSHGRARSESQASLGKQKASLGPSVSASVREQRDPFKAWRSEVMDVNKMTMKEIKARTFEGIKDLASEVKQQNVLFKHCWLRETDADHLYENRTLHTAHGIRVSERAERKYEAWKQKAWKPSPASLQKKEEQRQLFSHYGVPMYSSEPDLRAWGRVLRESHARTPVERERRRRELEEKRKKEEEARHQASDEQAALAQRYRSLKKPGVVLMGRS